MQKELANDDAVACQVALEAADVLKALLPDIFRDQFGWQLLLFQEFPMHAHDQGLLVIAAIENSDPTALRQTLDTAPKKIVVQILGRWRLERIDLASLWVDAGHDVLDRTVFPRGIHRLKH